MFYTAKIYKEDDIYVAECLELGVVSQGYTVEEALENLKEATELYLEEFGSILKKEEVYKKVNPFITIFEVSI